MNTVVFESLDRKVRVVARNFWFTVQRRHFVGSAWHNVEALRNQDNACKVANAIA